MKQILDQPVITAIVLLLVIVGSVDVLLDGDLSQGYKELLRSIDVPLGLLALGRGIQAAGDKRPRGS